MGPVPAPVPAPTPGPCGLRDQVACRPEPELGRGARRLEAGRGSPLVRRWEGGGEGAAAQRPMDRARRRLEPTPGPAPLRVACGCERGQDVAMGGIGGRTQGADNVRAGGYWMWVGRACLLPPAAAHY